MTYSEWKCRSQFTNVGGDVHLRVGERAESMYYTGITARHTMRWEADSWMGMLRNTTLLLTTHWNLCPDVGILGRRRRRGVFKPVQGPAHSSKVCCALVWGSVNLVMLTVLSKCPMHQIQVVIHNVSVKSLVHFSCLYWAPGCQTVLSENKTMDWKIAMTLGIRSARTTSSVMGKNSAE